MEFGLFGGLDDGGCDGTDLVEIAEIFVMQEIFFFEMASFDGI